MGRKLCTVEVWAGGTSRSLVLERADNIFRRARGLMGRVSWDGTDGMLFVYPWPRVTGIWMAGTHLALDAVFVDGGGHIVKIVHDLVPESKQAVYSGARVKWLLEIPAGASDKLGLNVGDRIEVKGNIGEIP